MIRGLIATTVAATVLTGALALPVLETPAAQLFGLEIVGRHHDPFTVMQQYAAGGVPPPFLQPATDLPGIALARALDPVVTYNLLILISFALAAALGYAHAFHLLQSAPGAALAALLFALSPFHLAHAAYHLHVAQIQWVPLFFLCWWRLLERPSTARALAATLSLLLVGAASLYLGFVAGTVAPVAALAYSVNRARVARPRRALAYATGSLAAAALIMLAGAWQAAPALLDNARAFAFPAASLDQHSARWWSYLMPPAVHPWLGDHARDLWRSAGISEGLLEQQVSLGLAVMSLAALALIRRRGNPHFALTPLAITALAAAVCSLTLAAVVLHTVVPFFRAYARFGVVVSLMVTTLAGAGLTMMLRRGTRGALVVAYALVTVAVFEYLPSTPYARDVLPTAAHRWLAPIPGARVLDCVTPAPGSTAGVAWLMRAEVTVADGMLRDCAEPEFGRKLAAFGFTHVIVRREPQTLAWLESGDEPGGTRRLRSFPHADVLEVTAPRPEVYVGELSGFYPREYGGGASWRWMPHEAALTLVNTTSTVVPVVLDLELEAFARNRTVRVSAAGAVLGDLAVSPVPGWHRIGPLSLGVGATAVRLSSDGAASPGDAGTASDPRMLSISVRRWRVQRWPGPY